MKLLLSVHFLATWVMSGCFSPVVGKLDVILPIFFQFVFHCNSAYCDFSRKNLPKHLVINKKPTTFAPAIERDAVVKGLEGLKIIKKTSDNLDRKNKSSYLCSHVSRRERLLKKEIFERITYQQVVQGSCMVSIQ